MSKLGRWSTTPGSNNATPPDGWPEGQAPSTVNDCAREMMASIRTVFNDAQYFDQDFTPTYVAATQFSVTGNQTSAIHAGRRLKIFDATAGVATVIYATVVTASFTAVTNIHISADGGQLTSSLSSFAIAILSQTNSSFPNLLGLNRVSASAAEVTGVLSASVVAAGTINVGFISCSATAVATNIPKAWVRFNGSAGAAIVGQFNVGSVSRSAAGIYRITFTNALADGNYLFQLNAISGDGTVRAFEHVSIGATAIKFRVRDVSASVKDADVISGVFFR